jgi:hypothetical protein
MTLVLAILAIAAGPPDTYEPKFEFCNTRECDHRVTEIRRERRHRRRVQARHKAAVRVAKQIAKMSAVVRPYAGWLAGVRSCESGGNYAISTGNGFYGAYQFTLRSWAAAGGVGYPHLASRLEQDYRAVRLLFIQGRGAWPICG